VPPVVFVLQTHFCLHSLRPFRESQERLNIAMTSQLGAINSINNLIGKVFTQPKGDFVSFLVCFITLGAEVPSISLSVSLQAGRLNSRITVSILGLSAGLLLTTHFWGDPITLG